MGWLLAVCRNLCLTRLRREERHAALSEENGTPFPRGSADWTPTSVHCTRRRIGDLTDEERRVVLLHAVTA